jgi:hypothetical protein
MTWGWNARGPLPVDGNATGTTGGGTRGGVADAGRTQAWPRYEAEYLKRALQSDRYKYDTEGLDPEQKQVYLEKVTKGYKGEADECLKAEFDQWLQGLHDANDPESEQEYENSDGKPIRRWVMRTKEAEDDEGGSKVGQARAGWKHTPWGRASLTGLPGVRQYLRGDKEAANDNDLKMQILAEFGPQNLEEAWKYFKHWVKGRPLSDAVALPARFDHIGQNTRSDFGRQMPTRMYTYDSDQPDRQPGVLATDRNAYNAASALPGEQPVRTTTETEDRHLMDTRHLREQLEGLLRLSDSEAHSQQEAQIAESEMVRREDRAEDKDVEDAAGEEFVDEVERQTQAVRQTELTAPARELLPAMK